MRAGPRLVASIGLVLLCFVLATPRSGGPDEPSHMVASAAVVRLERAGEVFDPDPAYRVFEVPAMIGEPNPACWALQPEQPAGCASLPSDDTGDVRAITTSANYPPWSYVLPGLASFVPWASGYAYIARLLMAVVPLALVAAALMRTRSIGPGATAAALVGLTPIAWFSMAIVNPSAVAIAGGIALWVALLTPPDRRGDVLLLAGWAATLLPRRDGPIWTTLIVLAVCFALNRRPRSFVLERPRAVQMAAAGLAVVPVVVTLLGGFRDLNLLLAASPATLVAVDLFLPYWVNLRSRRDRVLVGSGFALVALALGWLAVSMRPGGFDESVLLLIMSNTGEHLQQLVGVLGWVDTPVPLAAVFAFWCAIGALAALAFLEQPRIAASGAAVLGATIVAAWVLELGQGANYGSYWQGRYSMPFVVGLPLLLAIRTGASPRAGTSMTVARLGTPLVVTVWVILNLGFAGALHRWGVGLSGSWAPQQWDTWGAPLPPWMLLVVHGAATAVLVSTVREGRE